MENSINTFSPGNTQTLNIHNWRTTSAKSINLDVIKNLTKYKKYSLKKIYEKAMFNKIKNHIISSIS